MLANLGGSIPESVAKRILIQIIAGFNYLYANKVIHRDCKLDNLLIHFPNRPDSQEVDLRAINWNTEEFVIKIADFGYSRRLDHN
jgi:serine/threonine protein kinase